MSSRKNAAIILLGMGENHAAEILKILNQKDVEAIIEVMNNIDDVSEHEVIKALNDFFKETQLTSGLNATSGNYIRNTLVSAVGSEKAESMIDMEKKTKANELKGLELIKWQPVHQIVEAIQDEHPQIITVTLMCLDSEKSAQVLKCLPTNVSSDVIKRMTHSNQVSQFAMNALSNYFEEQFTRSEKFKFITDDGVNLAASIIAQLDVKSEHDILDSLGQQDQEITEKLQDKLFPFERLGELDSRSLQTLIAEISNEDQILALKGADEEIQDIFFKSMSSKTAELLKEDMESKGPVKLAEVLQAQKRIVALAKQLSVEEKIFIPTGKENAGTV